MTNFPALFISHGAPLLAIEDGPAHRYLKSLGNVLGKPKAVIMISAHHIARQTAVTTDTDPATIYDFGAFPQALFEIVYSAPGAPLLAKKIIETLNTSGFEAVGQAQRGFDHGAWVPMHLMYPQADVPMVQVSIDMSKSPEWHYQLGQALAPFRKDDVLIIGSGSITHNLREWAYGGYDHDARPPNWVTRFTEWLVERIEVGDTESVLKAVTKGPNGKRNHPSMDHILPLFSALGAGTGEASAARRLHKSTTYGVLGMDVYGIGESNTISGIDDLKSQYNGQAA